MTSSVPGLAARPPFPAEDAADERCMRIALEAARRASLAGEPPIGACLVRGSLVLATTSNSVISDLDITAHAEMNLIRDACRRQRTLDLSGCELYVTVEPCPMCYAASHYARIGRIVFGAGLDDLHALTGSEMTRNPSLCGVSPPVLSGGCLRAESLALLQSWAGGRRR